MIEKIGVLKLMIKEAVKMSQSTDEKEEIFQEAVVEGEKHSA